MDSIAETAARIGETVFPQSLNFIIKNNKSKFQLFASTYMDILHMKEAEA